MMRAGDLNRRITVKEEVLSKNTFGEETRTYQDRYSAWASVRPLRGGEKFEEVLRQAKRVAKFGIRFRKDGTGNLDMDSTNVIDFDGLDWDIHSIVEIGIRQGIEVIAIARVK